MKFNFKQTNRFSLAVLALISLAACSDDDTVVDDGGETPVETGAQYLIASTDSENSYLNTTSDISQGSVSPLGGTATQVIGTPSWYFYNDIAAYSFVYNQGDPGTTQSFALNSAGEVEARNEINLNVSIQSRGIVDNLMYVQYSSRNYEEPVSTFYTINGDTQVVSGPYTIDTEALAGNGEYAYVTDVAQWGDYVLLGFRPIKAGSDDGDSAFNSDFNDHTYVGVFNKALELQTVIEDEGRTGAVAGQSRSQGETGVEPVENGDVYVFSSAIDAEGEVPSGVLKINNGTLAFDQDYFFDITAASGGYAVYRSFYVGENTFVLQMFTEPGSGTASSSATRNKFAVVNVVDQTFEWVTGIPEGITSIGAPYIDEDNNEVAFPIETNLYPTIFIVNADTATMSEGIEVVAEGISAIGKLTPQE